MNVLPTPCQISYHTGSVVLPDRVRLEGPDSERVERAVRRVLGITNDNAQQRFTIRWSLATDCPTGVEGYHLQVTENSIELDAESIWARCTALHLYPNGLMDVQSPALKLSMHRVTRGVG